MARGFHQALAAGMLGAMLTMLAGASAQAEADKVRIGVLNDHFGTYADFSGLTSFEAARMAAEDFGGSVLGKPVEILAGDHENNKDKAVAIATEWFDKKGVSAVVDMTNSGAALAIQELTRQKSKIALFSGPATTALTGKSCSPTGMHWTFDSYSQAIGTARALVKEGKDSWFVLAVDDAFGKSMEADISKAVQDAGGKIIGTRHHGLNAVDFSKDLIEAQKSGAKVVALANAGNDTINAIKQAAALGMADAGQTLAGMVIVISDIDYIGLEDSKGLSFLTAFYWDRDDDSRAWSKRFRDRTGRMPGMIQAGVYSATLHYLKAVEAAQTEDAQTVARKMKEMPVNDMFAKNGKIREDGRMVHDMYLARVKAPQNAKTEWGYYDILRTVPGDEAFLPLAKSDCPLVKK